MGGEIMSEDNKFIGFHVSDAIRRRLRCQAAEETKARGSKVTVAEILRRIVKEKLKCR